MSKPNDCIVQSISGLWGGRTRARENVTHVRHSEFGLRNPNGQVLKCTEMRFVIGKIGDVILWMKQAHTQHTHPVTWSIRFILPKTTIPFNIFDIKLNENLVSPIYMFHQNLTTNDTNAVCWNARNRSRLISRRLLSLVLDFGKCCAEQNKILNKK